jgi:hypothetical protein
VTEQEVREKIHHAIVTTLPPSAISDGRSGAWKRSMRDLERKLVALLVEAAGQPAEKSNAEIVAGANALAAKFYRRESKDAGKEATFHDATHPEEVHMWELACVAYNHIEDTDVENALTLWEEEQTE